MKPLLRSLAVLFLLPTAAWATPTGEIGLHGYSNSDPIGAPGETCAACHTAPATRHTGSPTVTNGSNAAYGTIPLQAASSFKLRTTSLSGAVDAAGFNLAVVNGSGTPQAGLAAVAANTEVFTNELIHNAAQNKSGSTVEWAFNWDPPASGSFDFYYCVNLVDHVSGDAAADSVNDNPVCGNQTVTVNTPPVAGAASGSALEAGSTASINLNSFTSDANGHTRTITQINGSAATGSAIVVPNGSVVRTGNSIVFTHNGSETTSSSFSYQVSDGFDISNGTVTITVTPVNDPPVLASAAGDASYTENDAAGVLLDSQITISDADNPTFNRAEVIFDGFDASQDQLLCPPSLATGLSCAYGAEPALPNYLIITSNTVNTLADYRTALRGVRYRNSSDAPSASSRTIYFRIRDAGGSFNEDGGGMPFIRVVNITATPDAPVAGADNLGVQRNASNVPLAVLANDVDVDNNPVSNAGLSISAVALAAGQPVMAGESFTRIAGNTQISYTPPPNFSGARQLEYMVTDGTASVVGSLSITVSASQPPVADNDSATVAEDSGQTSLPVLVGDTDPDNDSLSVDLATLGMPDRGGSVSVALDGLSVLYSPSAHFNGSESFTYRARDNSGLVSAAATVTVTVTPVADAPLAVADSGPAGIREDSGAVTLTVLGNDSDADNLPPTLANAGLSVASVVATSAQGGTVSSNGTTLSYTPRSHYFGSDSVSYTVVQSGDPAGLCGAGCTATVSLSVAPVNDAPGINSSAVLTARDAQPYSYAVTVQDVDDTAFTYEISGAPSTGTAMSISSSGLITWTPPAATHLSGYNVGPITVTVTDSGGSEGAAVKLTATQTFSIAVSVPDSDGDGMPDSFELAQGFDPADGSDASADRDGDGRSNLAEFQAGGDVNADDVPPVVSAPAALRVPATGYLTAVTLGNASAQDFKDGPRSVTATALINGVLTVLPQPLRPGAYTVSYAATDTAGNRGTATQLVEILPLAEFGPAQRTGEGVTRNIPLMLNGLAPQYPVLLQYTVSGTASSGQDFAALSGSVTLAASATEALIPVQVLSDALSEAPETLVLTLSSASNAAIGMQASHTLHIVDANVAPQASIRVTQFGQARSLLPADAGQGHATVQAQVSDPNPGDTLFTYDWTASDSALSAPASSVAQFTLDPRSVPPGHYTLRLTVRDAGGLVTQALQSITVLAALPPLTGDDTDGDGIADDDEWLRDDDGDGIPGYLDNLNVPNVLPTQVNGTGMGALLQAPSGLTLSLGPAALAADANGARITADEVGSGPGTADRLENNGGLFDFELRGLLPGASAPVVLPLSSGIRPGAVYRKYTAASGWRDFVSNGVDSVASASSSGGVCPGPGHASYAAGLLPFRDCVQLTLTDGGPNDADGMANGVIRDPGGVAVAPALPPAPPPSGSVSGSESGNGGALGAFLLIVLGLFAGAKRPYRFMAAGRSNVNKY